MLDKDILQRRLSGFTL